MPPLDALKIEAWVMVSEVPPLVHAPRVFSVIDPPDAAFHVIALRVVDPTEMFDVPEAPGSPVWIWMNGVAIAADAVFRKVSRSALAFAAEIPTVI